MTSWQRTEWLDHYVEDGEAVVMLDDGTVTALSPVAWAALEVIGDGKAPLDRVSEHLVARFGRPEPPATASELTLGTLELLEASGLLSRIV